MLNMVENNELRSIALTRNLRGIDGAIKPDTMNVIYFIAPPEDNEILAQATERLAEKLPEGISCAVKSPTIRKAVEMIVVAFGDEPTLLTSVSGLEKDEVHAVVEELKDEAATSPDVYDKFVLRELRKNGH